MDIDELELEVVTEVGWTLVRLGPERMVRRARRDAQTIVTPTLREAVGVIVSAVGHLVWDLAFWR